MKKIFLLLLVLFVGCRQSIQVESEDFGVRLHELHIQKHDIQINWMLNESAQKHANWMCKNHIVNHIGQNGGDPASRTEYTGWTAIAENIAFGQESPEEVMKSWMNSSGHRANILNKKYTYMGIGIAEDESGIFWCVVFAN